MEGGGGAPFIQHVHLLCGERMREKGRGYSPYYPCHTSFDSMVSRVYITSPTLFPGH